MYLNRFAKQAALLKTLRVPEMRSMPLSTLWHIRQLLKDEKLVRLNGQTIINSFLPPFPGRAFQGMIRGLNRIRRGEAVPVSAYVAVTNRCRYDCWHCSKAHRAGQELPPGVMRESVRAIQDLGVSIIGFTGGEPLLRPDLEDIMRSVDDRSVILLFTTGDGLTEKRALELKKCGLFGVAVSLDHYEAGIHDQRRGRAGAYATAVSAVKIARRLGFYTMIQLVATRDMAQPDAFDRYLELARRLDVHEIRLLEPMPSGRLLDSGRCFLLSPAERQALKNLHLRTNRDLSLPKVCAFAHIESPEMYGCGAGFQHLYIDAGGNVCPCDFTPISFGNICREPLSRIWIRMNAAFGRPRPCCFLMQNADRLRGAFEGRLPIQYGKVKEICHCAPDQPLPRYYEAMGWKQLKAV
ncbi:MAG: radical SAM protein [Kiritimatiellia bacterium]